MQMCYATYTPHFRCTAEGKKDEKEVKRGRKCNNVVKEIGCTFSIMLSLQRKLKGKEES